EPPITCSGAAYFGVNEDPASRVSTVAGCSPVSSSISLAMLKSSSLTWPSRLTRTFDGFRSRCTMRLACACDTAACTSRKRRMRASMPSCSSSQNRSMWRPSMCSSTRYGWPVVDTPASISRAMCGCVSREDRPLALETRLAAAADERGVEELQRRLALEQPVAAGREPDAAHPAVSDRRHQRVRADGDTGQGGLERLDRRRGIKKAFGRKASMLLEQRRHVGRPLGVLHLPGRQPPVALLRRQVQDPIEMIARAEPAAAVDAPHTPSQYEDRKRPAKDDITRPDRGPAAPDRGRSGPSPSPAARCAPTPATSRRFPRKRSHRRT